MNYYLQHIKSLYYRPTLNGIDGNMELRAASPFELFLDLIFVIALSKLTYLFETQTLTGFLEGSLLFLLIYSLWHTLATYTVMFMKKETNYWVRAMIFIVMVPLIFFLGIQNFSSHLEVVVFCFTLALSKLFLSLIFRDSIVNAPLNNIVTSNLYLTISRSQFISALILLVAAFVQNNLIFISLLVIIAFREIVIISIRKKHIINNSFAPLLINKQLFMERQLLFIILIFGESLVSIVNSIASNYRPISIFHITLVFAIMFLFYVRISEETEHNSALIETSDRLTFWLVIDYTLFLLFFILSSIPHLFATNTHMPPAYLLLLVGILLFTIISHLHMNNQNLKTIDDPLEALYYHLDNKVLKSMLIVVGLLVCFHGSATIIYLLLLLYFGLHVLALPFRKHLIAEKCNLAVHLRKNK